MGHLIPNLKHGKRVHLILECAYKKYEKEYHVCQAVQIWLSMEMVGKVNLTLSPTLPAVWYKFFAY